MYQHAYQTVGFVPREMDELEDDSLFENNIL